MQPRRFASDIVLPAPAPYLCVLGWVDGRVRLIVVAPRPRLAPQLPRQDALREGAPAPVAGVLRHNALRFSCKWWMAWCIVGRGMMHSWKGHGVCAS